MSRAESASRRPRQSRPLTEIYTRRRRRAGGRRGPFGSCPGSFATAAAALWRNPARPVPIGGCELADKSSAAAAVAARPGGCPLARPYVTPAGRPVGSARQASDARGALRTSGRQKPIIANNNNNNNYNKGAQARSRFCAVSEPARTTHTHAHTHSPAHKTAATNNNWRNGLAQLNIISKTRCGRFVVYAKTGRNISLGLPPYKRTDRCARRASGRPAKRMIHYD
jgi:hypothetical protein